MNPIVGWSLAAAGVALAWTQYGWRGVLLAVSVIVFWLLLQFTRSLRVMRMAAQRPVGHVDSAVMLASRLREGQTLLQVIPLTRSLGERVEPAAADADEAWRWTDGGGASVTGQWRGGRLLRWALARGAGDDATTGTEGGSAQAHD